MRIAMCSIHVSDPAAAYRFYSEVLGFESQLTMPEHGVYVVNAPGQDTGLLLEPSDDEIVTGYTRHLRQQAIPVMVLGTDDLDADVQRLREAGVAVGEPFSDASGRSVNFDDTVGNVIQLHEAVTR